MQTNWKHLWPVDKDEDDPDFSSQSATAELPRMRTYTSIVEDILTQLTKVKGWSQILQEEFGSQCDQAGGRIQADSGDMDDDLQTVVDKLTIDAEEETPYVPADLSTHVVFVSGSLSFPLFSSYSRQRYYSCSGWRIYPGDRAKETKALSHCT